MLYIFTIIPPPPLPPILSLGGGLGCRLIFISVLVSLFLQGSNYVKVWDILSGGRLLMAFSNHQKTITSICFDSSCQRLLSAGLDK